MSKRSLFARLASCKVVICAGDLGIFHQHKPHSESEAQYERPRDQPNQKG